MTAGTSPFGRWGRFTLWAVAAAYLAYVATAYVDGFRRAERGERPLYTDFTTTYGAALLLRQAAPEYAYVYHPQAIREANRAAGNAAYGGGLSERQTDNIIGRWLYPPTFIFPVLPLAFLAYLPALFVWLAGTLAAYLLAVRAVIGRWALALPLALALPPTFFNTMFGQTGFLSAGLIGLGLAKLRAAPLLAGVLIGLASVKPHLGILLPVALLAGGHGRAFAAAAATVVALALASAAAFGLEPWYAFIGTSLNNIEGFRINAFAWPIMTSLLSLFHLLGASQPVAWALQWAGALAAALLVGAAWWRQRAATGLDGLRAAVLCAAIPFATPMIYLYDLVISSLAAVFLVADMRRRGTNRWEVALLVVSQLALLGVKPLGGAVGVLLGMTGLALVLALALWRLRLVFALGPQGRP
jgi:hypothetical protein